MSDMYFKSLPDKSTPLIPDNLDKLNDIKVSPTQPTTNEKVWIQKGKNLFNAATNIEARGFCRLCTDGILGQNTSFCSVKVKVKPNTIYVTSSNIIYTEWSNLCYFDKNMNFISGDNYNGENKVFTTPENCYYITIALLNTYTWFQLEQGSTATEYEAYIEKTIWCKNDNGVYEPFYNESDFKPEIITTETGIAEKYPDGRLVQYGDYTTDAINGNSGYNKNIILPVPFIDTTYGISITKTAGGVGGFATVGDSVFKSRDVLYFTHWNFVEGTTEPLSYSWTAIGRWK